MKEVANIIKNIAKQEGISEAQCRRDMEEVIDYVYNNPDPSKRKKLNEMFGDRKPTLEEFIVKMALRIKSNN